MEPVESITAAALSELLKAPSKSFVESLLHRVFLTRLDAAPESLRQGLVEALEMDAADPGTPARAAAVLAALRAFVQRCVFEGRWTAEAAVALLPGGLHAGLAAMLSGGVAARSAEWRRIAQQQLVALPRLQSAEWSVAVRSASSLVDRMAAPSLVVRLAVQPPPLRSGAVGQPADVVFELSRDELDSMLAGLGKIRDQLAGIQ